MIHNLDNNFIFVHIPRTGGMAITESLLTYFPKSYVDVMNDRHKYGRDCKNLDYVKEVWGDIYKFAFVRNPWDAIESDYRLCMRDVEILHEYSKMELYYPWYSRLKKISKYKSFNEYVAREFLGKNMIQEGGYWKTWCCDLDGKDLGMKIFKFENLESSWKIICEEIGMNDNPLLKTNNSESINHTFKYMRIMYNKLGLELPKMPKIIRQPINCKWSNAVKDAIGELCNIDVEKFDYKFKGQLV